MVDCWCVLLWLVSKYLWGGILVSRLDAARQELAFGKYAWLVNGLMFNFQHIYMPWNLIAMLPGALFVAYAVQRQKKTWMSIIFHGLVNIILLIFVIQGVAG